MELTENDKRFYSAEELLKLEPVFQKKFSVGTGGQPNQTHVLLSPLEYRAKFYWLDQENRWIDIGTGRFRILLSKDNIEHYIQIVSEDNIDYDESRAGQDDDIINNDPVVGEQSEGMPKAVVDGQEKNSARQGTMLHRSFIGRL